MCGKNVFIAMINNVILILMHIQMYQENRQ